MEVRRPHGQGGTKGGEATVGMGHRSLSAAAVPRVIGATCHGGERQCVCLSGHGSGGPGTLSLPPHILSSVTRWQGEIKRVERDSLGGKGGEPRPGQGRGGVKSAHSRRSSVAKGGRTLPPPLRVPP